MTNIESEKHQLDRDAMVRASKVGPKAAIQEIRLVEHRAKLEEIRDQEPELIRTGRGFSFVRNEETSEVSVTVGFKFEMAYKEGEVLTPSASVEGIYGLLYKVEELANLDDKDLEAFAQVNGIFNAWPFWRELVHSSLGRMGLRPVTNPTLRVSERPASDQAEPHR